MGVTIGLDIAKEFHWAVAVSTDTGEVLVSQRVNNDPDSIAGLVTIVQGLMREHGEVMVGIDIMGGIASLLTAMLLDAQLPLVHVPGLVVNRARHATRGGEHKSDPRDAKVIADQLRMRQDWRTVADEDPVVADIRMLISRRRELVTEQTRRLNRLRELLTTFFPGAEKVIDVTNLGDLHLLSRYVTPAQLRRAGTQRLTQYLRGLGVKTTYAERLVTNALTAARAQRIEVTGQSRLAEFAREFATEAIGVRRRISEIDAEIAKALDSHPDTTLIRSLPGMGATLTAEFIAAAGDLGRFPSPNALASAAGLAPVLQQSGKMHYLRRANAGSKRLKFIFTQSAFVAIQRDPASRAFYDRKRAEGKRRDQALIALARRRVNVLTAILRTRQPYQPGYPNQGTHAA